ncbi:hypothetical protein TRFO_12286 [Tritrichomonas foetus]|uniref:RhoGAP domain containing protein n=1 Tax=Tritrichomonas foetus TaxID=1144522 RepID=A0A1J4J5L3_9EUKA|nr:hypothetical protein TRFO_12286 [Tritrichomonas foetus]|eukprot:OHS92741.1 hypothetical protein TRFO_12286 [Tritrichomonas foetus]
MSTLDRYYRYYDKNHGTDYYHNPITNKITWRFPKNAEVYDGMTNEKIKRPKNPNLMPRKLISCETMEVKSEQPPKRFLNRGSSMTIASNYSKRTNNFSKKRRTTLLSLAKQQSSEIFAGLKNNKRSDNSSYLPENSGDDLYTFDFPLFITTYINLKKKHVKKSGKHDKYLSYESAKSAKDSIPVLKTTDRSLSKVAVTCFQHINDFCSGSKLKAFELFCILQDTKNQNLTDEVFVQLVKQTRNNSNNDNLFKVWELILLVSSFFVASPNIQKLVRNTLAINAYGTNKSISTIATLAYLRLISRHPDLDQRLNVKNLVDSIVNTEKRGYSPFSTTLNEQMWYQRQISPKCTIPLTLPLIVHYIFKNKGPETNGLFKKSGNDESIDVLLDKFLNNHSVLKETSPIDCASLLKRWFSELRSPIMPNKFYAYFEKDPEMSVEIIQKVPLYNRMTAMYVIGFLQDILQYEKTTGFSLPLLSNIFGALFFPPIEEYSNKVIQCTKIGKGVVTNLVKNWNTKSIYPLSTDLLPDEMFK